MKEIMQEIRDRFEQELKEYGDTMTRAQTIALYDKICAEVYLEKTSLLLDRK